MVVAEEIIIRISGDTSDIDGDLSRLKGNLAGFKSGFKKIGAGLARSGAVMSAAVTAPIVMIGKKIVDVVADYEAQMNILEVASRSAGVGIDVLDAAVLKVGGDTDLMGISAAEAAEGVTNLYKAGLDTIEIFGDLDGYLAGNTTLTGALRAAVDLAAASELDLDRTSELLAISMATYGLEASEATNITDLFVKAADASVASVSELADGAAAVGPVMKSFGWGIEDTATMLALLSEQGLAGADAGTAVRSMMTNLMRPVDDVTDALDELNVELFDNQGMMHDWPHIMGQIERAFEGLTEEQKLNYIQLLAGSRGQIAMNALLEQGTEGWKDMEKGIESAATAQQVAEARMKGFRGAMEQLEGVLETLMITVGKPLIQDFLTPLASKITEAASAALSSAGVWGKWALGIAAVLAAAGPVLIILGAIVSAVGALLSPIGLVVAAIAGLALAWGLNWGGIRDKTFEIIAEIAPKLKEVWAWLQEQLPLALAYAKDRWDAMWAGLAPAIEAAIPEIEAAFEAIKNFLEAEIPGAVTETGNFWDQMWKDFGQDVADGIAESKIQIADFRALLQILASDAELIKVQWAGAMSVIGNAFKLMEADATAAFAHISNASLLMQADMDTVFAHISTGSQLMQADMDTAFNSMSLGMTTLQTSVSVSMTGIVATVQSGLNQIVIAWNTNWMNIRTIVTTAINLMVADFNRGMARMRSIVTSAINSIRAAFTAGWNAMRSIVNSAVNAIVGAINRMVSRLRSIVGAAGAARSAIAGVSGAIRAIVGAVSGAIGALGRLASKLASIKPPSFLTGRSPSPFEATLTNIDQLLTSISRGSLPEFSAAMGTAGAAGAIDRSTTTTQNFTMIVNTSASHEPIIADFLLLQSLAGGA